VSNNSGLFLSNSWLVNYDVLSPGGSKLLSRVGSTAFLHKGLLILKVWAGGLCLGVYVELSSESSTRSKIALTSM